MSEKLRIVLASEMRVADSRLRPDAVYVFRCCHCDHVGEVTLPSHPSGMGGSRACGFRLDLNDQADKREYFACYERVTDEAGDEQERF